MMSAQERNIPLRYAIASKGTELNCGLSEDSDSVVATDDVLVCVTGELANGAIPVRLVSPEGTLSEEIFFWHQPEAMVLLNQNK